MGTSKSLSPVGELLVFPCSFELRRMAERPKNFHMIL